MAYNKDNYEHNRLTPSQEKFVDNIMQGKTRLPFSQNTTLYSITLKCACQSKIKLFSSLRSARGRAVLKRRTLA